MFKRIISLITPIFLLLNVFITSALAKDYTATVLSNHDGDTLTVKIDGKKEKVRLLGIDTAEMQQGYWGKEARKFTYELTKGKTVRLETDVQERDQYGRILAYVYIGNTFLNKVLLDEGYAQVLTYSPNVKYVDMFTAAQRTAREAGKGIWDQNNRLKESPKEFRNKNRNRS